MRRFFSGFLTYILFFTMTYSYNGWAGTTVRPSSGRSVMDIVPSPGDLTAAATNQIVSIIQERAAEAGAVFVRTLGMVAVDELLEKNAEGNAEDIASSLFKRGGKVVKQKLINFSEDPLGISEIIKEKFIRKYGKRVTSEVVSALRNHFVPDNKGAGNFEAICKGCFPEILNALISLTIDPMLIVVGVAVGALVRTQSQIMDIFNFFVTTIKNLLLLILESIWGAMKLFFNQIILGKIFKSKNDAERVKKELTADQKLENLENIAGTICYLAVIIAGIYMGWQSVLGRVRGKIADGARFVDDLRADFWNKVFRVFKKDFEVRTSILAHLSWTNVYTFYRLGAAAQPQDISAAAKKLCIQLASSSEARQPLDGGVGEYEFDAETRTMTLYFEPQTRPEGKTDEDIQADFDAMVKEASSSCSSPLNVEVVLDLNAIS